MTQQRVRSPSTCPLNYEDQNLADSAARCFGRAFCVPLASELALAWPTWIGSHFNKAS